MTVRSTSGRVVVAMSGGVDSSVAAALLVEQGHDVVGVSMQLYDQRGGGQAWGSCCTIDDLRDAARVASRLGMPHYIVNFEEEFRRVVVSDFVEEYAAGRTPLPCAHCNTDLKFSTLLERAQALDAPMLATGHYARVERRPDGRWLLKRGLDADKDQSYFLFGLTQDQLAAALFPVGSLSKEQVRDQARRLGLAVADKPDSQEICFIPDHDYASFVHARAGSDGGAIVDEQGAVLGTHGGVHRFTVGQRKGLGLSSSVPLFVVALDAPSQTVTVGPKTSLERTQLTASSVNWIATDGTFDELRVYAQIRHRHPQAACRMRPVGPGRVACEFDAPQIAVTPGQAVVFYDGETVVGGGWID
jgi:tRNA-specific 2-thiouridylase